MSDDMPDISERYRSSINSRNLKSDARTTRSDSDVLAAAGFAHRVLTQGFRTVGEGETEPVKPAPLAVPLERLFAGDAKAAHEIVSILGDMIWRQGRKLRVKVTTVQACDIARACLAWHRDGTCRACGGHGFLAISGAPMLSDRECESCSGVGKMAFDKHFHAHHQELARWSVVQMQMEAGRAAPEAMRSLAERIRL